MATKQKTKKTKRPRKPKAVYMRQPFVTCFVGINGTGKSTRLKNLILKSSNQRALIVTNNDTPKIWREYELIDTSDRKAMRDFKGIRKAHVARQGKKNIFVEINKNLHNAIVVFDDCRPYIKANIEHVPGMHQFLVDFRHHGLDVFFVIHNPNQIPPDVWGYTQMCFLFMTNRMIKKAAEISDPESFVKYQRLVNAEFKKAKQKGDNSHFDAYKCIKL